MTLEVQQVRDIQQHTADEKGVGDLCTEQMAAASREDESVGPL